MSVLQILCIWVVATTLFSQYEAEPDYTMKELKDLCDSYEFKYCRQYIRTTPRMEYITPKVDFRKYYGPAESQFYPGWIFGLFAKTDCNSSWAFAGAGVVEGVFSWKTNQGPVSLSKQELVDCGSTRGCDGGATFMALEYIRVNGICKTQDFGYRFERQATYCFGHRHNVLDFLYLFGDRFNYPHFFQNAFEYNRLEKNANAKTIMEVIEQYGPISVTLSVGKEFNDYDKYWALSSSDVQVSGGTKHSVVVVGYGEPDYYRKPYWIIRNSYGPDWGTNGYGLLEQTEDASEINREVIYITNTKF